MSFKEKYFAAASKNGVSAAEARKLLKDLRISYESGIPFVTNLRRVEQDLLELRDKVVHGSSTPAENTVTYNSQFKKSVSTKR